MKKVLFYLIICSILVSGTGCSKKVEKVFNPQQELFMLGLTLDDGRHVSFSFEVPYLRSSSSNLFGAFMNGEITVEVFLKQLNYVDTLRDGGSTIYHYDKNQKEFGNEDFYAISCNTIDYNQDIYIAKKKENLMNKCSIKIDDLENVSMTIKEDTLTNKGATVIITDTSDRNNIYGEGYQLEKEENGVWVEMKPKHDMTFISIGYSVNENHTLELKVNWDYHYGTLESGKYRILKDTSYAGEGTKHYITTEFVIA